MEKLRCNRCGKVCDDKKSVDFIKEHAESWIAYCEKAGVKARGIAPCPSLVCDGEMVLEEE